MKDFKIVQIMSNVYPFIANCNKIMYIVLMPEIYLPSYIFKYACCSLIFKCR
jgi:hypothetical protein